MNLASKKANLCGIASFFKFLSFFRFFPFAWSLQECSLKARSAVFFVYWIILGPVLTALHTLSSIVVLAQTVHNHLRSGTALENDVGALLGFALTTILIQSNAAVTAYGASIAFNYGEVTHLFNQIVHSQCILNDLGATLRRNISGFTVVIVIYSVRIYSSIALCISQPEKPLFLYWAFPVQWKSCTTHKLYAVFNAFYACNYWATFFFTVISCFLMIETSRAWLEFGRSQTQSKFKHEVKSYRELLVVLRIFENALGKWALPTLVSSCTAIVTFSAYGVIRFWGGVSLKLYVSFVSPFVGLNCVLGYLLLPGALMKQESQYWKRKMRNSVDYVNRGRYARAVLRSLPDMKLKVGSYFTIERMTHVTVLGLVSVNAMTLLITL